MTTKTAQPPRKTKAKSGGKAKPKQTTNAEKLKVRSVSKTVERDGGLYRVYARLELHDKETLDQLATEDGRSSMNYLERLLKKHCEQARQKKTK